MTLCNLSIKGGARFGMVAPDQMTFDYVHGRPFAPIGPMWDRALDQWVNLPSDPEARFDREVVIDAAEIAPIVTWGTPPEEALPITDVVPDSCVTENCARHQGAGRP